MKPTLPKIVVADWMPEDQAMLVSPGIKVEVTQPDGQVSEYWEREPSAVLIKNLKVPR